MTASAIRPCRASDAPRIAAIYNHFVRDTLVTFEEAPVSDAEMARRIDEVTAQHPWLVWDDGAGAAAYAYATTWKTRSAYRYSVESTVYVEPGRERRGIGSALYGALIEALRARDVHCVIGGITLPNAASVALHEKLGFRKIGVFREVGFKLGGWADVGYWALTL
jgi:phosphinothricin acetyltransferase